jgi:hypothetical protein
MLKWKWGINRSVRNDSDTSSFPYPRLFGALPNPRFVVTNLVGRAQTLYDQIYCAGGEMENRIKDQQLGLFSDRTSCHCWWPNQFRLLLSSCAYVLLEALRRLGLKSTELARAQVGTIRLKLLKIGAVVTRNNRRVRIWFSSAFPAQKPIQVLLGLLLWLTLHWCWPRHLLKNGGCARGVFRR